MRIFNLETNQFVSILDVNHDLAKEYTDLGFINNRPVGVFDGNKFEYLPHHYTAFASLEVD